MMRRLGADTVLVCSAAGPDVIADDLSGGQLAEPVVTGIVFVEIGVDGVSGPALANGLRGLGSRHTGQHRSKSVRLREAA
jgi:4-hydroxyphenylpyruvate dioxygenase-like putative hemolysin